MTTYAYLRVSTDKGQTTDNQKKVIQDAGLVVDEWVSEEGVSGSIPALQRPAFSAMAARMKAGDTLFIVAVDRLGRTASDILNTVEALAARGIQVRVKQFDNVDITQGMGKMILTCMSAMAELEKSMLIERTKAGLERTKAKGTKLGPPLTIEPSVLAHIIKDRPTHTLVQLVAKYNIPKNTIDRNVARWKDNMEEYKKEWAIREVQYSEKKAA